MRRSRSPVFIAICIGAVGIVGVVIASALSTQPNDIESAMRYAADVAGFVATGSAVLILLLERDCALGVAQTNLWRLSAIGAVLWAIAEMSLTLIAAADIVGTTPLHLGVTDLEEVLHSTTLGTLGLLAIVAPLVIAGISIDATTGGTGWTPWLTLVLASLGLIARPMSGHMSLETLGLITIAVHVIAAAIWCGTMFTAALTIHTTAGWTAFLPRFSHLATACVGLISITAIIAALQRITAGELITTPYGYILLAKTVAFAILLIGGAHFRRTWLHHHTAPTTSIRRAISEATAMAITTGLAATLAITA